MARKSQSSGCLGAIILLGVGYWLLRDHLGWFVGGLAALLCFAFLIRGKICDFCGGEIKRVSNRWRVDGKRKIACPECSRRLQREASKQAVDGALGKK